MSKVAINVGDEFPAEEVNPPESDCHDHICSDREEWHRRHAEWHAKASAFRDNVHRAAHRHFDGDSFLAQNMFMLRALVAVLAVVLLIALLPHMLLLGILLTVIAFVLFQRHRFHGHHYDTPRGNTGV